MSPFRFSSRLRQARAALVIGWLGIASGVGAEFNYDPSGNEILLTNLNALPLGIVAQPKSLLADVGDAVSFSVVAAASSSLTYQWQFNTNNISGANDQTLLLTNISPAAFGAYRVIVSDGTTSVTSSNATLDLDSDHDGMADWWEIKYFGSITNRSGFEDYDGDGVSDRDEYRQGTDPKNASSLNPALTIYSDRGRVFVTPNIPFFTNGQTITLTGVPDPGQQFIGYIGQPYSGGPFYGMRTNPAALRFGAIGSAGSQVIRAIFGLPIPDSLDVTNGWRIDQAGWFGQTNITHDGVSAAQSARSFGGEEAWLELSNVTLASEGTITFWWKVDGTPLDQLRFFRNNLLRPFAIGTNTDWQLRTYYLPAGTNVVRWVYHKGGNEVSEYNGLLYAPADAGWVDQVAYAPWPDPSIDSDGDGLPDIWEFKYFDTLAYGPNDDPDNDGISNLDEFLDRTDPSSNASFLPRLHLFSSGGGIIVANPNLPKYTLGQTVQLQAVPDPTNYFVLWTGALSGTNSTNSILMNGNKTINATFGLPLEYVVDTRALSFTRFGVIGWFGQTNVSYDGQASAQTGPVGFNQPSGMETTVNGPGTLTFLWKALSPTNTSFARFLIDGTEQPGSISGDTGWLVQSYLIASGAHTLSWIYTNRTATVSLTNGAWVDQVVFSTTNLPPMIYAQPSGLTVLQTSNATFRVTAAGTPPFSYQWYRNGLSLGATATAATLVVSNVSAADAGPYTVQVGNSVQTITSSPALLTVLPIPPGNDDFANRATISTATMEVGYTFGATKEVGETNHAGFTGGGRSVWWSWTAPSNGVFELSVTATNLSSPMAAVVYTGSALSTLLDVGSAVGQDQFTNGTWQSAVSVSFNATAGTTYAIAVDHNQFVPEAFITLSIFPIAPTLGSVGFDTGGAFGFSFFAPPGAMYVIEASADLQVWVAVTQGTVPADGSVSYIDPPMQARQLKFFRVQLLP